jgi:hypothetical protein
MNHAYKAYKTLWFVLAISASTCLGSNVTVARTPEELLAIQNQEDFFVSAIKSLTSGSFTDTFMRQSKQFEHKINLLVRELTPPVEDVKLEDKLSPVAMLVLWHWLRGQNAKNAKKDTSGV